MTSYPIAEGVWPWPTDRPNDCKALTGEPDVSIVVNRHGHDALTEEQLHAIARGHLSRTPGTWTYRAQQRQPSPQGVTVSFLAEFKSIVTELEAEGHALAGKASGLFGTAEKVIEGVASEIAPVIVQVRADVTADITTLLAQASGDAATLGAEALADLKAEIAKVKAAVEALNPAAPATPAEPAAPTA